MCIRMYIYMYIYIYLIYINTVFNNITIELFIEQERALYTCAADIYVLHVCISSSTHGS